MQYLSLEKNQLGVEGICYASFHEINVDAEMVNLGVEGARLLSELLNHICIEYLFIQNKCDRQPGNRTSIISDKL